MPHSKTGSKTCPCGKPSIGWKLSAWCCKDCYEIEKEQYKTVEKPVDNEDSTRNCIICGKDFMPKIHNQLCCTRACKKVRESILNKIRNNSNKNKVATYNYKFCTI